MTDAREIIAQEFRRAHRYTCYPDATTGECEIAASAIVAALEAAGFRIIGPDEQAVTEAFKEVAQWHEKNARHCREASEDLRLSDVDRARAKDAARHHGASAAAIRNKLIGERRAALKAAIEAGQ